MAEYSIDLQTVEESDTRVSVSGTVNGVQVAATLMKADVPASGTKRQKALAEALVEAFVGRVDNSAHPGMIKVIR